MVSGHECSPPPAKVLESCALSASFGGRIWVRPEEKGGSGTEEHQRVGAWALGHNRLRMLAVFVGKSLNLSVPLTGACEKHMV